MLFVNELTVEKAGGVYRHAWRRLDAHMGERWQNVYLHEKLRILRRLVRKKYHIMGFLPCNKKCNKNPLRKNVEISTFKKITISFGRWNVPWNIRETFKIHDNGVFFDGNSCKYTFLQKMEAHQLPMKHSKVREARKACHL